MKKRFLDYIDHRGLITGILNGSRELGDTLQRCGFWFIANILMLRLGLFDKYVYIVGNETEALEAVKTSEEGAAAVFIQMYNECLVDKSGWPIRHPDYIDKGKTSRDQMMSNLWSLLYISKSSEYAKNELNRLWKLFLKNKLVLPANDILGPEHLTVFWRFFKQESNSIFMSGLYSILILLGDLHNILSTLYKNYHSKKVRYHSDDVNRLVMVFGPALIQPTILSNLSLYLYIKYRPAFVASIGKHYHGKPNNEYIQDKSKCGADQAMYHYCITQEAPLDILYKPVLMYLYDKSNTDSIKKFLSSRF